jgi:2-methylcitrate dehydratase PrpD
LTDGLGKSFEILHTAVKPHSCCRYMQGPIDAILAIVRGHNVDAGEIQRIEIAVLEAGWGIVAEPKEKKYNPESVVDAQFSMPFGAAIAVLDGAAGLDQFTITKARSPKVRELMAKVVMVKDASIEATFPKEWPARVVVELTGGQRFENFVRYPKGDPENPLTWDEMIAKFRRLAGAVISSERCDEIIEGISGAKPAQLPAMCI